MIGTALDERKIGILDFLSRAKVNSGRCPFSSLRSREWAQRCKNSILGNPIGPPRLRCLYSTHCSEAHEPTYRYILLQSSSCRSKNQHACGHGHRSTCSYQTSSLVSLNKDVTSAWISLPRLLHRRREFHLHLSASSHLTSKSEQSHRSCISELQHSRLGTYT